MSYLDDLYETGENYAPWRPQYVEHMNTLAQSGICGVGEVERSPRKRGRASETHRVHPPLTEDEKRWLDSLITSASFDELYRATLRDLGVNA